jgi:hypothetical protein
MVYVAGYCGNTGHEPLVAGAGRVALRTLGPSTRVD